MTSKERNFLRKMAHNLQPMVRVGKEGLSNSVIESIRDYLNKNELMKVKLLQNSLEDVNMELIKNIEDGTKSIFVASIGKIMIFFKEKKENNKLGKITEEFYNFKRGNKKWVVV